MAELARDEIESLQASLDARVRVAGREGSICCPPAAGPLFPPARPPHSTRPPARPPTNQPTNPPAHASIGRGIGSRCCCFRGTRLMRRTLCLRRVCVWLGGGAGTPTRGGETKGGEA